MPQLGIDDEGARLDALRGVGLLDAEADPALQRLTRLAGELLGVPISLVSLVEAGRQYFAGATGLATPLDVERETPLSHSICKHVVERQGPVVIDDCSRSELLAGNRGVSEYGVMAYAGMPLTLADGETLGAFCAVDKRPHHWTERELRVLEQFAALAVDVLEARRERQLRDRLTGLAGRALFGELVTRAIARAARGERACAVVAIGLDGFRTVNDALGHAAGDALLQAVAGRLSGALRTGDAACRLAGDEFLVLCDALETEAQVEAVVARLQAALTDTPCDALGQPVPVSATVGVASTSTMLAADDLIDAALDALSRHKGGAIEAAGRPDPQRRARATRRLQLQHALAGVEQRGELQVVYQPLVDLQHGRLNGFEALLRWTHPQLGPIRPDEFIPVAERTGAIIDIGEWVLQRAAEDVAAWRRGGRELSVSVNVAPMQLRSATFPERVAEICAVSGLPPQSLTLEITERVLLDDRPAYARAMAELRELGVRVALDDFGTGYSALSYLSRFPLDVLKIDRGFVAALDGDPRAAALLEAITKMAAALHLDTVGEGIETERQLAQLTASGCDVGQGYHLARPLPAEELPALLGRVWETGGDDAGAPPG